METLFDLVLVAAALYGAKAYLTAPEVVSDREVFSSRGSMFVKRLVSEQVGQGRQSQPATPIPRSEPPLAQPEPSQGIIAEAEPTLPAESDIPAAVTVSPAEQDADLLPVAVELQVPQDSVLNRHYWAQRAAERTAIEQPYPTDSVLLRHYRQKQAAALQLVAQEAVAASVTDQAAVAVKVDATVGIPEDSVLKRHFLANARNLVEQKYGPRPSDSVLLRHRRQLVEADLTDYLAGLA
ncbi:hypothetical protein NP603_00615 [Methylomonas sp. SURF-1]|uniref:Uncharacterized protein n=1 Tax=Methylomonas aurea TaxID=2952224 RepID=A0ABT1UBJ2_9GAMM|nr:hypothetical protein [Methylomonas sp. SURF-1]MCQ8179595.1 hypothetical protein [Methylomonas sp. SURF-1]